MRCAAILCLCLCLCLCPLCQFVLRPLPGSRVNLNSEHTQGAGIRSRGAPAKGKMHRIQYPPSVLNTNKDQNLREGVTKP